MKLIISPRSLRSVITAGAFAGCLALITAQADTIITFSVDMSTNIANGSFVPGVNTVEAHGTFNGYGALALVQAGSSTIYTNSIDDTTDTNSGQMQYKYVTQPGGNWENLATGQNRSVLLPATSGASLVLPTAFYADDGAAVTNNVTFQVDLAQQIALGVFTNGSSTVEVRGLFNSWTGGAAPLTNNPSILRTNNGVVTADVYTGTFPVAQSPGGVEAYKFVINNGSTVWDSPNPVNSDGGGNRYFANVAQTLPVVYFADAPYAPLCQVTFNVDMSAVLLGNPNFVPGSVVVDGSFNGWASDLPLTNNPAAANTNIYSGSVSVGQTSTVYYQFRYQDAANGTQYDHDPSGNNRQLTIPLGVTSTNVPAPYFNNVSPLDLLNQDTVVTFSVSMTNAVQYNTSTAFNPSSDSVFINGDFTGWLAWSPISLSPYALTNNPPGSEVYSYTQTFAKGQPRQVNYKYSIDGSDNEAGYNQNHQRYIRSNNGVYQMPLDTFGTQYVEPKWGNLAIGGTSGGHIPITWLGYPGTHLQTRSSLSTGSWTNLLGTDTQSSTNYPVTGTSGYFRLTGPQ